MDFSKILHCLTHPNDQRSAIICLGDIMLDRFEHGDVERISPEAPIPVLHLKQEIKMIGGVGNVVRNIASLDNPTHVFSVVGKDSIAQELQQCLDQIPQTNATFVKDPLRPTTVKIRYIANNQQLLRVDQETTQPLSGEKETFILNHLHDLPLPGIIVISDYGKGFLTPSLLKKILSFAQNHNIPTLVDPKGQDYSRYQGAFIITPNRSELAQATSMPTQNDDDIVKACRKLISQHHFQHVLATRGPEGMTLVSKNNQKPIHLPTQAQEIFDVSGAGDTVIATLAFCLNQGFGLEEAAYTANCAAGIVVGKVGTATTTKQEILDAIQRRDQAHDEKKVVGLDQLLEAALAYRRRGQKIGFTNGCFDLLHPGHISLLRQAKAACDILVVGLNSDDSVKRLKGDTRPIQSQLARSMVLAALSDVDFVTIFDQDTPKDLIQQLRPDVLVKGSDYTVDQVVGADFVQSYGGQIILIDLVPNQSTTKTIAKMNIAQNEGIFT